MLQRMKRQTKKITVRIATDNSPNVKIYIFIDCINEDIIFSSSILIFMFCVASLNDEKSVEAEDKKKMKETEKEARSACIILAYLVHCRNDWIVDDAIGKFLMTAAFVSDLHCANACHACHACLLCTYILKCSNDL